MLDAELQKAPRSSLATKRKRGKQSPYLYVLPMRSLMTGETNWKNKTTRCDQKFSEQKDNSYLLWIFETSPLQEDRLPRKCTKLLVAD